MAVHKVFIFYDRWCPQHGWHLGIQQNVCINHQPLWPKYRMYFLILAYKSRALRGRKNKIPGQMPTHRRHVARRVPLLPHKRPLCPLFSTRQYEIGTFLLHLTEARPEKYAYFQFLNLGYSLIQGYYTYFEFVKKSTQ